MWASRTLHSSGSPSPTVSRPITSTWPVLGVRMQPMMDKSVVLPLPEGPMNRTTSPGMTSRLTSLRATVSAAPRPKDLPRPRTEMLGPAAT